MDWVDSVWHCEKLMKKSGGKKGKGKKKFYPETVLKKAKDALGILVINKRQSQVLLDFFSGLCSVASNGKTCWRLFSMISIWI